MDFDALGCLSSPNSRGAGLSHLPSTDMDQDDHPLRSSEGSSKRPAPDHPGSQEREKRRKTSELEPEGEQFEATQREDNPAAPREESQEPSSPPTPRSPTAEASDAALPNEASKFGLTCVFCGEAFSLQRQPFLLPCGHSACQDDLKQLPLRGSSAVCPKDRQPIALTEADLTTLPLNDPMLEVLKETLTSSGQCSIEALLNPRISCALCGQDEATQFCVSCPPPYGDLCNGCFNTEHCTYVSKRHKLLPSKSQRLLHVPCKIHTDKENILRLYCKRCKKMACDDCKTYGEHRQHQDELDLTQNLAGELEKQFQTLINNARKCMEDCDGVLQRLTDCLADIQSVSAAATVTVKSDFEELEKTLKSRQEFLLSKIELTAEQRRSSLQQHRQEAAMARARLESVVQYCSIVLRSGVLQQLEKKDTASSRFKRAQNEAEALSHLSPAMDTQIEVKLPRASFVDFINAYGSVAAPPKAPSSVSFALEDIALLPAGASAASSSVVSAPLSPSAPSSSSLPSSSAAESAQDAVSSPTRSVLTQAAASISASAAATPDAQAAADSQCHLNGTTATPPLASHQRSTSSPVLSQAISHFSQLTPPPPVSADSIMDALRSRQMERFEQMVQDPALSRDDLISVFFGAVRTCQVAVVDWLIRTKRVDASWCHPQKHYSALHLAAATDSVDLVKLLISFEVDVKGRDTYGATPFLWAAQGGCLAVAQYLAERGADVNDQDTQGNRALHVAARNGNLDIVKWLVEKRMSPAVLNSAGLSALDMAKRKAVTTGKDMSEVIRYLERMTPVLLD